MNRTNLVVLLALLFLSACRTSKPTCTQEPVIVTNTDSIRTEYIETVRIDTVTVEVPVPIESASQVVKDSTSHVETSLAESDAWLNPDGSLGHTIKNKPQKLKGSALVPVRHTQTNNSSEKVREVPVPYPVKEYVEKELTKWQEFRIGAFWYLVTFSLCVLLYLNRKSLIKLFNFGFKNRN